MLRRNYRLPKEVKFKSQKNFDTPLFSAKVSKNGLEYSRFGFVVSKKIDKRAVVRNGIKRLLRLSVEKNLDKFPTGFDILFSAKEEIGRREYASIEKETSSFAKQIK